MPMKYYKVSINVVNFLLNLEGECFVKHGFYATRYVEAKNEQEAEKKAVDLVISQYREVAKNEKDDPPVAYVEEIVEVDSLEDTINEGASWYEE